MRRFARILVLIWGAWWAFFNIASAIGEGLEGWGWLGSVLHFAMGLVFVAFVLVTWRWERVGSIIIIVASLLFLVRFRAFSDPMLLITMILPPLLSGVTLLVAGPNSAGGSRPVQK